MRLTHSLFACLFVNAIPPSFWQVILGMTVSRIHICRFPRATSLNVHASERGGAFPPFRTDSIRAGPR
jgi:hypothetical protein